MPQSLPLSSNPSFKKNIIPFKTRKKKKLTTGLKVPKAEKEQDQVTAVCFYHIKNREETSGGARLWISTHTRAPCVSGGQHPPSRDTAPQPPLLELQTPWVGKVQTTSVQKRQRFSCGDDTFGVQTAGRAERFLRSRGQGLSPRDGDLPLVPLSHETGWVYNQRKGSQSFLKGAVMLVDWERSGQIFCQNRNSSEKAVSIKLCVYAYIWNHTDFSEVSPGKQS